MFPIRVGQGTDPRSYLGMIGLLRSDDVRARLRRYRQRMRAADGSAGGRWHSCLVADLWLTGALMIAAELEVVLGDSERSAPR